MQHTLVAVFDNRSDAQNAMTELLSSGFSPSDVNVSSAAAGDTGTAATAQDEGVGASIKHFFGNLFGADNDDQTTRYADAVSGGRHVLTVTTASEPAVERAADVIERFGPVDLDERHDGQTGAAGPGAAGTYGTQMDLQTGAPVGTTPSPSSTGAQGTGAASGAVSGATSGQADRDVAIPVVQEDLKVGKRQVARGGVRVVSRIVETPVDQSISLREEHVNVERRPVDQPLSPADAAAFKEQSIELRETAEEAVVQKSARVVEEVVVGKEVSQHEQQIHDTLRHTEVNVETLGAEDDDAFRQDWQTRYAAQGGTYDDYAPAYRYGNQMRSSDKYRGRNWNDVEADLRSDWDARGGGAPSTWDKMKAAVQSGWDRMKS
jgi:uncharacterized protein (TIGR02271 family)